MIINKIEEFLKIFTDWALAQPDIQVLALVGSHARNTATEASDVDLGIITHHPDNYLRDLSWIEVFEKVDRYQIEDFGKLVSARAWYEDGPEVEYGITDESWAALLLDEGTREVIAGGMRVLFEKEKMLSRHQPVNNSQK